MRDAGGDTDSKECMTKTMQAHGGLIGFGPGSARQFMLVYWAAPCSGLKTHGSGCNFQAHCEL